MAIKPDDTETTQQAFVPILTVLPEYGNAPFLWIVTTPEQRGVGPNISDGNWWDENQPMSEGLWQKFADWVNEFDRSELYYSNYPASDWDWEAFHERGLQLTRWLKEDVGDAYRVIYLKPGEDPNRALDSRREILSDGTWLALPPLKRAIPIPGDSDE